MSGRQRYIGFLAAVLAIGLGAAPALAASDAALGDAKAGKSAFKKACARCHQAEKERSGVGPHLVGIIGRPAASAADYKRYSDTLKASGIDWDAEQISAFVKSPKDFLAGTRMQKLGFRGIKDDSRIKDIVAYLTDLSAAN